MTSIPQTSAPATDLAARPTKLVIAVSFHFVSERLQYLQAIAVWFDQLADEVEIHILTNATSDEEHLRIRAALGAHRESASIHVPTLLGHPYLLTWSHREVFARRFNEAPEISHFLYLEDDICIRPHNIAYWMKGRQTLRQFGLIPSFLRYEQKDQAGELLCTDIVKPLDRLSIPSARVTENYIFLNMPNPYQGMYLLDRELLQEMLTDPSTSPDAGKWGIREKAARGVTFTKVPRGCYSRNFVGYRLDEKSIDPDCLIHHTPNNYANNPASVYGKVPVAELIRPDGPTPATSQHHPANAEPAAANA